MQTGSGQLSQFEGSDAARSRREENRLLVGSATFRLVQGDHDAKCRDVILFESPRRHGATALMRVVVVHGAGFSRDAFHILVRDEANGPTLLWKSDVHLIAI